MLETQKNNLLAVLFLLLSIFMYSCHEKQEHSKPVFFTLDFDHRIDNKAIVLNTQYYTNAANNHYRITEIKYFISALQLYKDGVKISIQQDDGIHYVDISDENTLQWKISQHLPEGMYDAVEFTFGLDAIDNQSFRFNNPPEANMAWPPLLGGGYHYMMLNGWFRQGDTIDAPLNIHLGKGQIYQGTTPDADAIIGFVDNHFHVRLSRSFLIKRDRTANLKIIMNVDNWFDAPFVYDFNYWGSHIMQNQSAQQMLKENGQNVFTMGD
jgi:hypothetical protein